MVRHTRFPLRLVSPADPITEPSKTPCTFELMQATILYCFFLVLFLWRSCIPWPRERSWRDYINYITLLYFLLVGLYVAALGEFVHAWYVDVKAAKTEATLPNWVRVLATVGPFCVGTTIAVCWVQSRYHLSEIRDGCAVLQHDRALNIIALPAAYSVIIMGGALAVYGTLTQDGPVSEQEIARVKAEYETNVFVADVYEAWALFQFGTLVSEYFKTFLGNQEIKAPASKRAEQGYDAPALSVSISALASVMWVGLSLFGMVCIAQAGYSLYLWYFNILHGVNRDFTEYEQSLSQFHIAGLVSSAGAIYNVAKFEDTFGEFIGSFSPLLKFMSVKMIVFFAFWQENILNAMRLCRILALTELEVKLLSLSLLSMECLLCALMHMVAWSSKEGWYSSYSEDYQERQPMLSDAGKETVDVGANQFSPGA